MTDDKANDLSGIRARDLLPDVTVPLKTDNPFEVPDGDFDFTHEEGETFSFLFDGTLVAEMSLGGVRLYGEHAADLSAKAFWKAMLVHNPYQGIVGRLTTRTEDLEALLRESANLIDTLRKDVEPLGDPLAFVTGESGREELERLRKANKAKPHDHGCCDGSWTHSLDCANSTDPWRELDVLKDENKELEERCDELASPLNAAQIQLEAKVRKLETELECESHNCDVHRLHANDTYVENQRLRGELDEARATANRVLSALSDDTTGDCRFCGLEGGENLSCSACTAIVHIAILADPN